MMRVYGRGRDSGVEVILSVEIMDNAVVPPTVEMITWFPWGDEVEAHFHVDPPKPGDYIKVIQPSLHRLKRSQRDHYLRSSVRAFLRAMKDLREQLIRMRDN